MFLPIPSHVYSPKQKNINFPNVSLSRFDRIIRIQLVCYAILASLMTGILQPYRSEWARLWTNCLLLAEGRTEWCYHHFSWCSSHSAHCLTFPGWYPYQKSGMLFRQPLKIIILSWNSWKLVLVQKIVTRQGWDSGIVLKLQVLHQPPFALKVAYHGFMLKGWTLEVVKFVEHRRNTVALFTKDTVGLQFLAEQCFKYI